jgi:site-specific DNA-methyltransferase (adenine-specific)
MDISKAIDKKFGAEREVVGKSKRHGGGKNFSSFGESLENNPHPDITAPSTDEAKQWEGWGTCLKPANEPIVVARKPISEKTIAENVLKWGTGGLNIDGCRVGTEVRNNPQAGFIRRGRTDEEVFLGTDKNRPEGTVEVTGRFPANIILDEEAGKLLDEQTGILTSGKMKQHIEGGQYNVYGKMYPRDVETIGDSGGASRFFYCAKASKKERGEGNTHPTVKPLKLISYLITLVTPPNGICLDIFEGSGTHALACIENEFKYIGFEKDVNYYKIAMSRIEKR